MLSAAVYNIVNLNTQNNRNNTRTRQEKRREMDNGNELMNLNLIVVRMSV